MQTRKQSALEVALNYLSGFGIAWLTLHYIARPVFGLEISYTQSTEITALFTVVSVARSYAWRRAFNYWQHGRGA